MYKQQLQELAQRCRFNLPWYSCIREGPDHAPRFKAIVDFNGEIFESPIFFFTRRQAEHAAAEVALNTLASRAPSRALAARILDETRVSKNLLQEAAHIAGLKLHVHTTVHSGPGHTTRYACTVELAGMNFAGKPAGTVKQAEKNAEMVAWSALKRLVHSSSWSCTSMSPSSTYVWGGSEEQECIIIVRFLLSLRPSDSENFRKIDSLQSQEKSFPVRKYVAPPLYPQGQIWAYPTPDEMVLCETWKQESSSRCSPSIYPSTFGNLNVEPGFNKLIFWDEKGERGEMGSKVENIQQGRRQRAEFVLAPGRVDTRYRHVGLQVQNSYGFDSSHSRSTLQHHPSPSDLRSFRPTACVASPPRMRIGAPFYPASALPQRKHP